MDAVNPRSEVLLQARGVTKTYTTGANSVTALRGVDLDVCAGDLITVMGPSGNGKTTLLNCLSGIDTIDAGEVIIDGHDINLFLFPLFFAKRQHEVIAYI